MLRHGKPFSQLIRRAGHYHETNRGTLNIVTVIVSIEKLARTQTAQICAVAKCR